MSRHGLDLDSLKKVWTLLRLPSFKIIQAVTNLTEMHLVKIGETYLYDIDWGSQHLVDRVQLQNTVLDHQSGLAEQRLGNLAIGLERRKNQGNEILKFLLYFKTTYLEMNNWKPKLLPILRTTYRVSKVLAFKNISDTVLRNKDINFLVGELLLCNCKITP